MTPSFPTRRSSDLLGEWRRILKRGALAMFSCLGPGSLAELRSAVLDAGLKTATPQFVDMHDFGDLLIQRGFADPVMDQDRKEHTSELQSLMRISYAVFCLKKKNTEKTTNHTTTHHTHYSYIHSNK